MNKESVYPSWKEAVVYGNGEPGHRTLIETAGYKAVLVGLEAGSNIPPHPAKTASYYILEGSGRMTIEDREVDLMPGATVVVPEGLPRGITADSKMALIASHGSGPVNESISMRSPMKSMMWIGAAAMTLMAILMVLFGRIFGNLGSMVQLMFPSGSGFGLWGMMLMPAAAMALMMGAMVLAYRKMARKKPTNHDVHHGATSRRKA